MNAKSKPPAVLAPPFVRENAVLAGGTGEDKGEVKMEIPGQSPTDSTAATEKQPAPLKGGRRLATLAAIGIVLLSIAVAFVYLGGWLSPNALTPARFVDEFERVGGIQSGFRRNHAKGVGVAGFFEGNGQGTRLSNAVVFRAGRVPVIGRFSFGGTDPYVSDAPGFVRGLGLMFQLPDGEEWRMAMVNQPVFPVNTPQAFYDRLVASEPDPKTGKPDPAKMAAFLESHPATVQAIRVINSHPPSSGFDNSVFSGLNAFYFINAGRKSIPVRWSMVPAQPSEPASATEPPQGDKNYLFDALIASMLRKPLQWHLIITIGQPGDPPDDATVAWPENREQVDVGTLTLDHIESEETSPARDINFDPLVLPVGIEPSDDPLLSARSAVYSQSFTRRAGEKKEPSAITPSEVQK
jgi:catalase